MKFFLLLCILAIVKSNVTQPKFEDMKRTIPNITNLIHKHGYDTEEYEIVTPDQYILRIHRIPPKIGVKPKNQTVFLMHGLLSSSIDWIIPGPGKSFAYILSDAGYDVWMGNARGNTQSRNNTHLDPDKNRKEFWDFSWHEIGYYDLPTMIDFILDRTNKSQLFYAGHSQGTTSFYVMLSMRPEYNQKIIAHFSLAPVVFMKHLTSPVLRFMSRFNGPLKLLLKLIGIDEILPTDDFIATIGNALCKDDTITQALCTNILFILCGFSPNEMNATILPELTKYTPAGSSTKQLLHYSQEMHSGHFRQYDYGLFGNLHKYGSIMAPDYDLNKITTPVYLFYSHNDWMAAEIDVLKLYNKLPNAKGRFLIIDSSFNHLDFMYGIHAREYVYERIISLMLKHNN